VVGEGALWVAPRTGPQEPHLDTVPVKTAAHLARYGVLPYAVFVAGAEPRTVWIHPAHGAPIRKTIPPCSAALIPTTLLHNGDANDGPHPVARLFFFLAASAWCVEDIEGEVSTFLRSNNTLPNNWVLVDGLHAAHWLRHRPREVRAALSDLAEV